MAAPESSMTIKPRGKLEGHVLPDVLAPGLDLWFVGTAAGPKSARLGAYYANRGNRFWRTLHEAGITPRLFEPHDFSEVLELGVGLTDFCKTGWGVDAAIDREALDVEGLRGKVRRLKPKALAFTSKSSASLWLGRPTGEIAVGRQARGRGEPLVFALTSPSGLARSWWSIEPWIELGAWLAAERSLQR
jgi:double-stranded uracil-DNA glycosylase